MNLKLCDKWSVKKGSHSWELVFQEKRTKTNKKTGLDEDYLFEDKYYYPTISQCLQRYINEKPKELKSLNDLRDLYNDVSKKIDEINIIFKN